MVVALSLIEEFKEWTGLDVDNFLKLTRANYPIVLQLRE